jgi:LmbE family N-acetylglucosaminyl deacetylase
MLEKRKETVMTFARHDAELYIPDGVSPQTAMARADILAICAHPDDIEVMAVPGILKAHARGGLRFFGVVATNGVGSMRSVDYADRSYLEMREIRIGEQKEAARLGRYSGLALLNYESGEVKDAGFTDIDTDLVGILKEIRPEEVYLHNPFDRHDTHIAVCLRSIEALRAVAAETGWMPERVYGAEHWRGLDWLVHCDRVALPVHDPEKISDQLLHVYKSQMMGVRQFDQAVRGRRIVNATYQEGYAIGNEHEVAFAVDLLPLVEDPTIRVTDYVRHTVDRFRADIVSRLERFAPGK